MAMVNFQRLIKHHTVKVWRTIELYFHTVSNTLLDTPEWLNLCRGRLRR